MNGTIHNLRRPQPLTIIAPPKWQGIAAPPYDWIVDGCFLRGTVAMLSGDGGLGKSLLMQQLCTAASVGKPWLGLATKKCRAFAMFCEDDEDELHRRQEKISAHYGVDHGDIEGAEFVSRVGEDSALAFFGQHGNAMTPTALFEQVREAVAALGAQIVIFDTIADIFTGDEIRRAQVRRFVTLLRRLAVETQGVVIVTAHPSLTGMNTGTGLSGSTAWNNSVRSRLYLTGPKENADVEDRNERWLKTMKNNQGPFGDKIALRWADGVFVRTDVADSAGRSFVDRLALDQKLCDALREMVRSGAMVAADNAASQGLANRARKLPGLRSHNFSVLVAAQDRLLAGGKIVRVEMGPPSKRRVYVRTTEQRYPGEPET